MSVTPLPAESASADEPHELPAARPTLVLNNATATAAELRGEIASARGAAERALVRLNEQRILAARAQRHITVFKTIRVTLSFVLFGFLIWVVIESMHLTSQKGKDFKCSNDFFHRWWIVILGILCIPNQILQSSIFLKYMCGFHLDQSDAVHSQTKDFCSRSLAYFVPTVVSPALPFRVQLWAAALLAINVVWQICGLVWVLQSDRCYDVVPGLQISYACLISCILILTAVSQLSVAGLAFIVDRLGLASPAGFDAWYSQEQILELCKQRKFDAVQFSNEGLATECPICMTEYTGGAPVVQTPCNHFFHPECLKNWGRRAHSCPLCRAGLRKDAGNGNGPPNVVIGQRILRGEAQDVQMLETLLQLEVLIAGFEDACNRQEADGADTAELRQQVERARNVLASTQNPHSLAATVQHLS